jgi:hypothetical protein
MLGYIRSGREIRLSVIGSMIKLGRKMKSVRHGIASIIRPCGRRQGKQSWTNSIGYVGIVCCAIE